MDKEIKIRDTLFTGEFHPHIAVRSLTFYLTTNFPKTIKNKSTIPPLKEPHMAKIQKKKNENLL
jgi:hypothetical protein